jgi:hypothetical protein
VATLPNTSKIFPPSITTEGTRYGGEIEVPDGIIAYLTRECGGNVHDKEVVEITSSTPFSEDPSDAARNVADLQTLSYFWSDYRWGEDIPHSRNNWICYDFKARKVVPTHYAIRSFSGEPGCSHLKAWVVEQSMDGDNWLVIDNKEDNNELNGKVITKVFRVVVSEPCRYIRLVNIGMNHMGNDTLMISAWEIFGTLLE